jgi:transcriptional regulator with XRE-family HTH domain
MTIKELRAEKKLSQAKLAASLGVSSSLIAAIEQGSKKVSANLAAKVKEVYGVALGESDKMASDAAAAKAAEEPVPEEKAEKKVKTTKKTPAKKAPVKKATAKKAAAPKTAVKKVSVPAPVFIQSPLGGEITPAEVLSKVPAGADKIYIRVDQNKAYWVKGEETGSVDLW